MEKGHALMDVLGVSSLDELRAVPASNVVDAAEGLLNTFWLHYGPMMDGVLVRSDFRTLFEGDDYLASEVPLLTGVTGNDGLGAGLPVSNVASYMAWVADSFETNAPTVLAVYPATNDTEAVEMQAYVGTLAVFAEPHRLIARALRDAGQPVYFYHWDYLQPTEECALYGAYHSVELPYVFNNMLIETNFVARDYLLADQISDYWVNFATTGDPNGTNLITWPLYGTNETALVVDTNAGYSTVSNWNAAELDFFSSVYPFTKYDGLLLYTNTIAKISEIVNGYVTNGDVVGLSLSLVDENGIIWSEGFGYADREQNISATGDTIYRLASLSKIFASIATLREMEQGHILLDAPVTNYMTGFAPKQRVDGNMPTIDYSTDPVTVRSLLDHMSGIQNAYTPYSETSVAFSNFLDIGITSASTDYRCLPVDFLVSYNNNGFQFAECLVQNLSGQSFASYMQDYFFGPLGMTNTGYDMDALALTGDLATSYFYNKERAPREYMNCLGTGGALSSANDMARFLRMVIRRGMVGNDRILSDATIVEMISDQTTNTSLYVGNKSLATGLGWDSAVLAEVDYAGNGCSKFGSIVTYGTYTAIATNQNLGIFVGVNTPQASVAISLGNTLLQMAVEDKTGLTVPAAPPLPSSPFVSGDVQTNVNALAGYYVNGGYTEIAAGTNCLLYSGTPVYLREDGWWSVSNTPAFLLGFTNAQGFSFSKMMQVSGNYLDTSVTGLRYDPLPLTNAWALRLDTKWVIASLPEMSYNRTHDGLMSATLREENGMLIMALPTIFTGQSDSGFYNRGDFVLDPFNDDIAFVQGSGYTIPGSVEILDAGKRFKATNYEWQRMDSIPALTMPGSTNISPDGDSLSWFSFDAVAGVEYYVNLGSGVTGLLMVTDADGNYDGAESSGVAMRWLCPSNGTYYAGILLPTNAPPSVTMSLYNYSNTIAHMRQWIEAAMTNEQVMGVSVALLDDQEIVWAEGFGYEDPVASKEMSTNSVFHIGSVSKAFTSATALRYLDRGAFVLDDVVTNIVPSIRWRERYGVTNVITVRHLLDMYSGLPGDMLRGGFTTTPRDIGYANITNDLANTWPIYPADYMWSYCNAGFVLMEGIIEALANTGATVRSFADIADDELLDPLGMEATSYLFDEAEISNNLTVAYYADGTRMPPEYVNIYGTGSMYSRPTALCRFMAMIFADGGSILQSNTVREMTSPQGTNAVFFPYWDYVPGLGWDSVSDSRLDYAGRNCSKSGGTLTETAMIHMLNEHKLGVALCSSTPSGIPSEGAIEMLRYALLDKTGMMWQTNTLAFPTATQTVNQADLDALAGIYVGGGGYDKVVAREGSLDFHALANIGESVMSNLTLRTNGWFVKDGASTAISFTNVAGKQVMLTHMLLENDTIINHSMRGDKIEPPAIHAAWLARTNDLWYVQNEDVYSYMPLSGTTPQVKLWESDGVLNLAGGLVGVKALIATNATQGWVYGLHNRVDSCVQVITNNSTEMLLYAGYLFSHISQIQTTSVTGSIDLAGSSGRYEIELPAANPMGSVTDVVYEITLSGSPTNFVLRVYDENGTGVLGQRNGNGLVELVDGGGVRYLYVQPLPDGVQTGAYVLNFECPVLLRDLSISRGGEVSLVWQGETNTAVTLETAERLDVTNAFVPVVTNIIPAGPLNSITNDVGLDVYKFYRIR